MPWTKANPPSVAKNWSEDEKERCVKAANAVLSEGKSDADAIYACIHAAGRSKRDTDDKAVHDYGSTQFNIPKDVADKVTALAATIPDDLLAEDGREDKPHVTVKYGLVGKYNDHVVALKKALKNQGPVSIKFGVTSLFESDDYDVLKFDVDSDDLQTLNKLIANTLDTVDTQPTYIPHVTVAYLKSGEGKAYVGDDSLNGQEVILDELVVSSKTEGSTVIKLLEQGNKEAIMPDDIILSDLKELSVDATRNAIYDLLNPHGDSLVTNPMASYKWIREFYKGDSGGRAIVESDGKLYQVDYTVDASDQVVLSDTVTEVEVVYQPVKGSDEKAMAMKKPDEDMEHDDEEDMPMHKAANMPEGKMKSMMRSMMATMKSMMAKMQSMVGGEEGTDDTDNETPKHADMKAGFKIFKTKSGAYRWLSRSTTAFRDRDREIFRTKALENCVAEADEVSSVDRGPLMFWHVKGTEFGKCDFQSVVGRFLIESGTFDNTPQAKKALEYFKKNPDVPFEMSIGYLYKAADRVDGIYDWLKITERSVCPPGTAANPWTTFATVKEVEEVDSTKKAILEGVFGAEFVADLVKKTEEDSKALEEKVDFKAFDMSQLAMEIGKVIQPLVETAQATATALASVQTDLKEIKDRQDKIEADQKAYAEKAQFSPRVANFYSPRPGVEIDSKELGEIGPTGTQNPNHPLNRPLGRASVGA